MIWSKIDDEEEDDNEEQDEEKVTASNDTTSNNITRDNQGSSLKSLRKKVEKKYPKDSNELFYIKKQIDFLLSFYDG